MLIRSCAALALLGLPAEALRAQILARNESATLRGWRDAVHQRLRGDPRAARLRKPLRQRADAPDRMEAYRSSCLLSEGEGCPLAKMTPGKVNSVVPTGEPVCISGDPFQFEVWPGRTDKLKIFFEGGGGCWNEHTIALGVCLEKVVPGNENIGFFNTCSKGDVQNPFSDYTVMHIRYCSGDLHVGNVTRSWNVEWKFGGGTTVRQHGYFNTRAAIDWAKANLAPRLESLVISGTSAGAAASQLWASTLLHEFSYEHATVVMDSFLAVVPGRFDAYMFDDFGVCEYPWFDLPFLAPLRTACKEHEMTMQQLGSVTMQAYPNVSFVHVTSKYDSVQRYFHDIIEQELNVASVAATYCADLGEDCDISAVPKARLEVGGMPAEDFYAGGVRVIKDYLKHPNFRWYFLAESVHGWAPLVFGDCPSVKSMVDVAAPGFTSLRREHVGRWIGNASNSIFSLPEDTCEDITYLGLSGCDPSLGGVLFAPGEPLRRAVVDEPSFDRSGGRPRAGRTSAKIWVATVSVAALALVQWG